MFDFHVAFKRNLGWVTEAEQEKLRNCKVAIGGLGGVGGDHFIGLARLGVANFHIADLDDYDYGNFNRQAGANVETVGHPKAKVMEQQIRLINPEVKITNFDEKGITEENLDDFLDGVDIYVDSLDIFAVDIRIKTFQRCHELGIPQLTAGPMGMGTAYAGFLPGKGMSFKEFTGMDHFPKDKAANLSDNPVELFMAKLEHYVDNILRFITAVSPAVLQRHYLVDDSKVNFFTKDLPSTKMGIDMASGVMNSNVLKVLLNRGEVVHSPSGLQYDAYLNKMVRTWRPGGHNNPIQKYMRNLLKKRLEVNEKLELIRQKVTEQHAQGVMKDKYSEDEMQEMLSNVS